MRTRRAAVAGTFYTDDPSVLAEEVGRYLEGGAGESLSDVGVGVSPHAGYVYSGPTAGVCFAALRHRKPGRVVLLGCSHRYRFAGPALGAYDAFETPLGRIGVDTELAARIRDRFGDAGDEPHVEEHCLETQLPFVQAAFPGARVLPVLFGGRAGAEHSVFGGALADLLGEEDVVVASTDLSHYLPLEEAVAMDRATLAAVASLDPARLRAAGMERALCGGAAVAAAMACAVRRGAVRGVVARHATSAEAFGDASRVVGYGAVVFCRDESTGETAQR
ncbi:MAG: AmmeMemoRadiSam system protein B [Candidatus Hydrogenedentes bacterium]|nr:AmmeMemoRadiSam system protein B [Candidatus Hydrogenedentota bacterium]